jgi:hypothetical protein
MHAGCGIVIDRQHGSALLPNPLQTHPYSSCLPYLSPPALGLACWCGACQHNLNMVNMFCVPTNVTALLLLKQGVLYTNPLVY